jgi:hypothetical protein
VVDTPVRCRSASVQISDQDADVAIAFGVSLERGSMLPSLLTSIPASNGATKGANVGALVVKDNVNTLGCDKRLVQTYEFKTGGRRREVSITHADDVWSINVDSEEVAKRKDGGIIPHGQPRETIDLRIPFDTQEYGSIEPLKATLTLEMAPLTPRWQHKLVVNGMPVPACWSKDEDSIDAEAPEVAPAWLNIRFL